MFDAILARFPSRTYPLILVADPDGILADEAFLAALSARGFRIIAESDPVTLRYRYQQAQPVTTDAPLIVVTTGALNRLPYDLWQQGHHVNLALHEFFTKLDYPTLRLLSSGQRSRLAQVRTRPGWPEHPLSPFQTADFLLDVIFDATIERLSRPGPLLLWLARYHAANDPMPQPLADRLLAELHRPDP